MNRLTTSGAGYDLARFPEDPRDQFRAWDAADEYLLRRLEGSDGPEPVGLSGAVVVVGDRWGALSTVLAAYRPVQITDSYLAQRATLANLERNGAAADAVRLLSARDTPPDRIDVLLVRVPKSLALLEDQLHRLAPAVHAGTVVIGTGMVKEIHTSTLKLFERIIGPTRTSLAVKKARLIFCTPDPALPRTPSPWPYRYDLPEDVGPVSGRTVTNHAGIFCAERLDIGTRFFLGHLPARSGPDRIVDLGCGNGVVGLSAALANPEATVTFVDESYQAVASAEETFRANTGPDATAEFLVGDGLTRLPPASVDLVLNNPPFHSHQATTDATARAMFHTARTALRPGGELWVVGNRHLGYHTQLRRTFGNCATVAGNPKFVVLRAVKR
ncbi:MULTISPECIES: methyltransferase [unclassified Streptomyces]|uniref:methyltransferase n=1 Tax=unclassified Streptomyces TaxID=2593676 RepID=UPI00224D0707|nr:MULTISPECIES: methyltransferase [unclassified Streptomyces]WSP53378.1 methyltransferase [Streptomyces sp. NBC_01241]WSU25950.1 methyltransferase [Streptomyces sp. NBC_01108]MCX4784748.1 methyltransferase [Streptomyces sp. NBC_01221]MCX4799294.1 methyltransferase [Streptomyces sp. NBC_01242]WSJ40477.1 methyltransferase [Streptomyces sp. NBC_01321]